MAKPIKPGTKTGRVDQGVDYQQQAPYTAVASGVVVRVSPPGSFWNPYGTGEAVYVKLDKPVTVNGRTYTQVYYAEQAPLVKVGQRVKPGQAVMKGGGAEIGFANRGAPAAKLVGGTGAGTQATQAGQDFLDYVNGQGDAPPASAPALSTPVFGQGTPSTTDPSGQNIVDQINASLRTIPQVGSQPPLAQPPLAGDQQDTTVIPVSSAANTWQLIASQGQVSPDTLRLASLANLAGNASGQ